jgi:GT2 family glycosyltransferase
MDLVVVDYHTPADLTRFVRAYEETQPEELETRLTVVLVEATEDEVSTARDLEYDVFSSPDNIGYNVACNEAARLTNADDPFDTIAFFNADTILARGVLEGCARHLEAPGTAVVGPRQVNRQGRITHAGIVGSNVRPVHRGWLERDGLQYVDVIDCVTVSGSAYFMRRDAFNALSACSMFQNSDPHATGAFGTFTHFYGDTWISYHARDHGLAVRYVGDVPAMRHELHGAGNADRVNQRFDQAKFRKMCADHGIECD